MLSLLMGACDGKVKSEFVAGCKSQGASESQCKCLYGKLKAKYGESGLEKVQTGETAPPGFAETVGSSVAQCRGDGDAPT